MCTVFQETRLRAGFKTGDFVKETLEGGYRRERLCSSPRYVCKTVFALNKNVIPRIFGSGASSYRNTKIALRDSSIE